MSDVRRSALEAIDDVHAVLARKAEAAETGSDLDAAVGGFATFFDEHVPPVWDDLDPVGRGRPGPLHAH